MTAARLLIGHRLNLVLNRRQRRHRLIRRRLHPQNLRLDLFTTRHSPIVNLLTRRHSVMFCVGWKTDVESVIGKLIRNVDDPPTMSGTCRSAAPPRDTKGASALSTVEVKPYRGTGRLVGRHPGAVDRPVLPGKCGEPGFVWARYDQDADRADDDREPDADAPWTRSRTMMRGTARTPDRTAPGITWLSQPWLGCHEPRAGHRAGCPATGTVRPARRGTRRSSRATDARWTPR